MIRRRVALGLVATAFAVAAAWVSAQAPSRAPAPAPAASYDVIIRHGRVLDGSGNPWFAADVAISGDHIAAIGDLSRATATRVIEAAGQYVAPGFIDTHTHDGPGLTTAALAPAQPQLAQGITTVFVNPDGGGDVDLAKQRAALLSHGLGVNVAQMVPHGSIRGRVMGNADRPATPAELDAMRALVRAGMQEGAWGLSAGPFYTPGSYAPNSEYIEVAKVAAEFGGAFQSHIRDESDYTIGVLASVDEVIAVAREAKVAAIVTHIKALGPSVWGFSTPIIRRIEQARAEGLEVWADQYPYEASATSLSAALLPRWAQAGGRADIEQRLGDPSTRARIRTEMAQNLKRRAGADHLQFRRYPQDPSIEGKTLGSVAAERHADPVDLALLLLQAGDVPIVSFTIAEDDLRAFLRQPWTMTASDGDLVPFGEGVPHPRSYGTFARKLRRYVADEQVVPLEFAIRSMTSLPALVFRMNDRGMLRTGAAADIVVFDLSRVRDAATFTRPHQLAQGMVHVFVNGRQAVADGAFTAERAGRVLRRVDSRAF